MKKREFTKEEIEKVIYNYTVLNMGQRRAGAEFHMSDSTVKRLLLENGVKIKSIQETNISKYKINHDYFSTQGHNQAYIIGFLGADGNISAKDNRIDLELFSLDKEILEKIREELGLERPIKVYECASGYVKNKLYFYSAKIKQDLMKFGLVPNKTYSSDYKFPYILEKQYVIDYIRGLFDGDGSVKDANGTICFQIDSSNKQILIEIQQFLKNNYNIEMQLTSNQKTNIVLYRLYCYGENSRKIYSILYTPNSLFLQRKYNKWQELLKRYNFPREFGSSDEE